MEETMSEAIEACDRVRVKDSTIEGYVLWYTRDGLVRLSLTESGRYEEYEPEELERLPDPSPEDRHATYEIVCPYCGYEASDSWEREGSRGETSCMRCEKEFHYARYTVCTYNTSVDENRV